MWLHSLQVMCCYQHVNHLKKKLETGKNKYGEITDDITPIPSF